MLDIKSTLAVLFAFFTLCTCCKTTQELSRSKDPIPTFHYDNTHDWIVRRSDRFIYPFQYEWERGSVKWIDPFSHR